MLDVNDAALEWPFSVARVAGSRFPGAAEYSIRVFLDVA
jgi:hypothetical protein